jgi:hypothetical protein
MRKTEGTRGPPSSSSGDSGVEEIGAKPENLLVNVPRKRGRPRKNPDEPRKKRGAIEYDPTGDSCTRILLEYKRNLELRALGLHPPNPFFQPKVPSVAEPKIPEPHQTMSDEIEKYHNFNPMYNINIS